MGSELAQRTRYRLFSKGSVVLLQPKHMPEGLAAHVATAFSSGWTEWTPITVAADTRIPPLEQLWDRFMERGGSFTAPDLHVLAQEPAFGARVIWLAGVDETNWLAWREFLIAYADVFRAQPVEGRTTFCVPLVGHVAADAEEPTEVGISTVAWYGCVKRLDMLVYVSQLLQHQTLPDLEKQLLSEVITNLAQWDAVVAQQLAQLDYQDMLQSKEVLAALAASRGWDDPALAGAPTWEAGLVDNFDGEERVHSAYLAVHKGKEWTRRIWSAQVRTLFPHIEEIRHKLLEYYSSLLTVPYVSGSGWMIDDPTDLEFSHIRAQLQKCRSRVGPEMLEYIDRLKDLRNDLAHQNVIAPERCCSQALAPPVRLVRHEAELHVLQGGGDTAGREAVAG